MKRTLILSMALIFTLSLNAQNDTKDIGWMNYTPNRFWDNWEVSGGIGVGTFVRIENGSTNLAFKDMPHISFNLAASKWFSPVLGGRFQFQASTAVSAELEFNGIRKAEDFSYVYMHYDQLLNLSNWICGYKFDRLYSAVVYIGAGLAINPTQANDLNKELAASVGFQNRFRLCDAWNIDLELSAMIVRGDFNSKVRGTAGVAADINIGVGATYKFKTRDWQPLPQCKQGDDDCAKRLSDLEKDNNNYKKALKDANDKNNQLQKELNNAKNSEKSSENKPSNTTVPRDESVSFTIFFNISEASLSDEAKTNIKTITELMKKGEGKTTYTITGFADKETGDHKHNLELSKKRVETVKKALVNAGIDAGRLKTDYKGDTLQPLGTGSINRCVIILQDK